MGLSNRDIQENIGRMHQEAGKKVSSMREAFKRKRECDSSEYARIQMEEIERMKKVLKQMDSLNEETRYAIDVSRKESLQKPPITSVDDVNEVCVDVLSVRKDIVVDIPEKEVFEFIRERLIQDYHELFASVGEGDFSVDSRIRKRISQISRSRESVFAVFRDLSEMLDKCSTTEKRLYCIGRIYENLIHQGEVQVSIFLPSAFPLARFIILLDGICPGFLRGFSGRVLSLFGFGDAGFKTMGRKDIDKKMGVFKILTSVFQAQASGKFVDIQMLWILMSYILNHKDQISEVTPIFIHSILEIGGYSMHGAYKHQFTKLIRYIAKMFVPVLRELKEERDISGPAIERLCIFIEDFTRNGFKPKIPPGSEILA